MVINPYADQLNFPAGTPLSLINLVMQMNAANRAQQNQPSWWETGLQSLLNNVVTPYVKTELIDLPYQKELGQFKTDEAIRLADVQSQQQRDREMAMEQYKNYLANEYRSTLGQGMGQFGEIAAQPVPGTITDTGPTQEYGMYEDPTSRTRGPGQFSLPELQALPTLLNTPGEPGGAVQQPPEPAQIQGEVSPTGQSRMITATPPRSKTSLEILTELAKNPLVAGTLGQELGKNTQLYNMIDPAQIANKEAQTKLNLDRSQGLAEDLQRKLSLAKTQEELNLSRAELNRANVGTAKAATERIEALAKTAEGRNLIMQMLANSINKQPGEAGYLPDEVFQRGAAILQNAQLTPTPGQREQTAIGVARQRTGTVNDKPNQSVIDLLIANLEAKRIARTITPEESNQLDGLKQMREDKSKFDLLRQLFGGGGLSAPTSTLGSSTSGAGNPIGQPPGPDYIWVRSKSTGKSGWLPKNNFDPNKYIK